MKSRLKVVMLYVFCMSLCLTGCIKSKELKNTTEEVITGQDMSVDENGIIDLTPDIESSSVEVVMDDTSTEEESAVSLSELSGQPGNDSLSVIEESSINESGSIKDKLPKDVLSSTDDAYIMNGVTVYFEDGLIEDAYVDAGEAYVSEDGKTYLMHDVSAVGDVTVEFISNRFEKNGVLKEHIRVGMVGDNSYVLAEYDNEDAVSIMTYVFVGNDLHLFTVAKEGLTISELRYIVLDILEHAQYNKSSARSTDSVDATDIDFNVYWTDKTCSIGNTKEVSVDDATTLIGDNWECIDESQNLYYCGSKDYSVSMAFYVAAHDMVDQYEEKYAEVITNTFGTPTEKNYITFSDESIIWTEYVYDTIDYQGKSMNIGVYVGKTSNGVFYAEFSTPSSNRLQYDYIVTVLDHVNTD